MNKLSQRRCDVFCNVIDNYGDIGVCWRLAYQLASEHTLSVRLWVDDLTSFAKLYPDINVDCAQQNYLNVQVCLWQKFFPIVEPADLVIEAFSCQLPESYLTAMVSANAECGYQKSVWISLEYLSAEAWVEGCHTLPSPHPILPLTKYYFFPGFNRKTGGLLIEENLISSRDEFQRNLEKQHAFWQSLSIQALTEGAVKISLFAYENFALASLLDAWVVNPKPIQCFVPEGRILPQLGDYFGVADPRVGNHYVRGNLSVYVLPFMTQPLYDLLLWSCDINFVRGEDSFVRAQWAGRPFVWHIYPQHDGVHLEKLSSFLTVYDKCMTLVEKNTLNSVWQSWNSAGNMAMVWPAFFKIQPELNQYAKSWSIELAKNNLTLNLLDFFQKIGRIRAFEIEGSSHENSTRTSRR